MIFRFNFVKMFLAYGQKYPREISVAMGINDHAESEYDIFIMRQPTLQNSFTVIWKSLSHFLRRKLFIKIFARHLGIPLRDNHRYLFSFLCSFQRNDSYGVCKKKMFLRGLICHHSIENLILHIIQVVSESSQVYE